MTFLNLYYQMKPMIPRRYQIMIRRRVAAYKRKVYRDIWPINPAALKTPEGWRGWPDGKKFALVLQHDVDTIRGTMRSLRLAELERKLGFWSSFNFVPKDYPTPYALRQKLHSWGFEVGVHGLKHDGKLFRHPERFFGKIPEINSYLKEWEAVGFTSPSMLGHLEWIGELNIEHGCSTYDTDPFEPGSNASGTIFPYFASNNKNTITYVELPYTLPQDHCLFVILKEKSIRIWKEKLDWIAEMGGMAELNSHPDYMNLDSRPCSNEEYPSELYSEFLEYIKSRYEGRYWHALPRDVAKFWRESRPEEERRIKPRVRAYKQIPDSIVRQSRQEARTPPAKIWIDLDNTPHVPFFIPIIRELNKRGHQVVLSARDAFQVCELADQKGLSYTRVGHHYGKNPFMKVIGLLWRSLQLVPFYLRQRPRVALSHGSRSQTLLCNLLRIPTILVLDYEYSRSIPLLGAPRWMIVPEALSPIGLPARIDRVRYYRGIKEDVYVPEFKPDPSDKEEIGLSDDKIVITVRPPATEAHYHNPDSEELLDDLMKRLSQTPGIIAVLLPRNRLQEETFRTHHPDWFANGKTVVPTRAVDGLNLIWSSDLVVSGGGTMNREAAALGVPVYSIFRGKKGAVDHMLEQEGRLTMIECPDEVWSKVRFVRRDKPPYMNNSPHPALHDIVKNIEDIIRLEHVRPYSDGKARRD